VTGAARLLVADLPCFYAVYRRLLLQACLRFPLAKARTAPENPGPLISPRKPVA
jgi:hypothetical protein